jgi:hypothetical protein
MGYMDAKNKEFNQNCNILLFAGMKFWILIISLRACLIVKRRDERRGWDGG